jgi:hypothetical protein
MWTVTLHKPGRPDSTRKVRHLGNVLELLVDRLHVVIPQWRWDDRWAELSRPHTGVFAEEYSPVEIDEMRQTCRAEFSKLRRVPELARHFDPNRLPA